VELSDISYDIIIPVFHPGASFARMLEMLQKQEIVPSRIILMETLQAGEAPGSYEGCCVYSVNEKDYDHAGTRRKAVSKSTADVFIMMTQDAMPVDNQLTKHLLTGLFEGADTPKNARTAMCYGRQLPAKDCGMAERFSREFNYPEQGMTKSIDDLKRLGIKTYFASNVCCAYNRAIYDRLGGFEKEAIFNEDMLYAAKALKAGCRIVYEPKARVIHSHNYTARQQFRRNFDNGMSQAMHPEVFGGIKSEGEGMRLVKLSALRLWKEGKPLAVITLIRHSGYKYLGFKLGRSWEKLPPSLVRTLAMNKVFIDRLQKRRQ